MKKDMVFEVNVNLAESYLYGVAKESTVIMRLIYKVAGPA